MRIAIMGQAYPPMISGAAIFSCHLAESLADRGHQVLVLAASDRGRSYCEEKGNLKVTRIVSLSNPARIGQRFMLWPVREIHTALEQFQPDLIHLHDPLQLADIAIAYARRVKIPILLTIHAHPGLVTSMLPDNSIIQDIAEQTLWRIATHLKNKVQVWITPTETNARLVERHTSIRPQVISNGIDLDDFPADRLPRQEEHVLKNRLGIPGEARVLLHVGRLDPGKNVAMVIEAASEVIRKDLSNAIHLLVVGDGIEKDDLQKQTDHLGISDRCHFPGYIREKDLLSAIYRSSDLFLMASTIETQGIVLLEAAASGLPIVAVDSTAVPEIVTHGVNGYLVHPGDFKNMAEYISKILNDKSLSERMRLESRLIALQHDFEKSVEAHERIYLSVLDKAYNAGNNLVSTEIVSILKKFHLLFINLEEMENQLPTEGNFFMRL